MFTNLDSFLYSHAIDAFIINNFENTTADIDKTQAYFKDLEKKNNNNNNSNIDGWNTNNNNDNQPSPLNIAPSSTAFYSPQ